MQEALASGPKTTKELALHVMASKGLDTGDKVLAHAMARRRSMRFANNGGEASCRMGGTQRALVS
jgi:hypothetical protein